MVRRNYRERVRDERAKTCFCILLQIAEGCRPTVIRW